MYTCYVDESGHCGRKFNPDQPVEVLCGAVSDTTKVHKTQKEQLEIIGVLNAHDIQASELRASHIYRGDGAWRGVAPEVRSNIMELILQWVRDRYCKFIVCPIDSKSFFDQKKAGCVTSNLFRFPYEAGAFKVVAALQRLNKSKKITRERPSLFLTNRLDMTKTSYLCSKVICRTATTLQDMSPGRVQSSNLCGLIKS